MSFKGIQALFCLASLVILFCLMPVHSYGSGSTDLAGRVINSETGSPITGAVVSITGTGHNEITDSSGAFSFAQLPIGEARLTARCMGYNAGEWILTLIADSTSNITLMLDPETVRFDDVTVTASRYHSTVFFQPKSISIATADEIDTRHITSTADALREEPGIMVQKTTQGHGAPIMRGLLGNYILLLYNNIRLNRPTFRYGPNQYLNTVDAESIDRIEIVKGPLSVLYGSDAMGGVINLLPRNRSNISSGASIRSTISTQYSSANDGRMIQGSMDAKYKRGLLRIGTGYKSIHDLDAGGDIGRQVPTGWNQTGMDACLDYLIAPRKTVTVDYMMMRQDAVSRYDKYVDGSNIQYLYDPQDRTLMAATFVSRSDNARLPLLTINASFQSEKEGRIKQKTGDTKITRELDKVFTWGGFIQAASFVSPTHRIVYGAETYYDRIRSSREDYDQGIIAEKRPSFPDESRYSSFGVFAEDRWQAMKRLMLTAGIRFSRFDIDAVLDPPYPELRETYNNITGALSCQFIASDQWQLYAGLARGFRAPNLDDAAVLKETNQGIDAPNPELGPEYNTYLEFGAKFKNASIQGSAAVYANWMHDLIDRRPGRYLGKTYYDANENDLRDEGELDVYIKQNVGRADIYGFEFQISYLIDRRWIIWSNGHWTWGENISDNEPLSRIPPITGQFGIRLQLTRSFWGESFIRAAGSQRRVSQRDISDSRIGPDGTDGWAILNVRFAWQSQRLKCNLLLENLTDVAYKTHGSGIYSAGRNVVVKITFWGQ